MKNQAPWTWSEVGVCADDLLTREEVERLLSYPGGIPASESVDIDIANGDLRPVNGFFLRQEVVAIIEAQLNDMRENPQCVTEHDEVYRRHIEASRAELATAVGAARSA